MRQKTLPQYIEWLIYGAKITTHAGMVGKQLWMRGRINAETFHLAVGVGKTVGYNVMINNIIRPSPFSQSVNERRTNRELPRAGW